MSTDHSYDHDEQDYGHNAMPSRKRQGASRQTASRPVAGRKRGKGPTSVNGIHKRRRRKMSW